jgi:hypothetical protein
MKIIIGSKVFDKGFKLKIFIFILYPSLKRGFGKFYFPRRIIKELFNKGDEAVSPNIKFKKNLQNSKK